MRDAVLDRRRPPRPEPGPRASSDELARHAGDRLLARPVDLGDADGVGGGERGSELLCEMARARVEVRLEEHEHAGGSRSRAAAIATAISDGWCA